MTKKKDILLMLILVFLHIFILYGLRFAAWPEMFSYPFLRNNGFLLYKDMIHPYPPLLTMALSIVYKIFGYELIVLKVFTYLMVFVNDIFIFLISKKIMGNKTKLLVFIPLIFYIFTQPFLDGNMLWFDYATSTPLLISLYFLFESFDKSDKSINLFYSGFFLTLAILIKQTFALFFVVSVIFLLLNRFKLKNILLMFVSPFILGTALLIRLIQEKALMDFLNWTLIYPSKFWTKFPGYVRMDIARQDFSYLLILSIPLIFIIFSFNKYLKQKKFIISFLFLICSLISVYPRFSFFHLQPALAILPVILVFLVNEKNKRNIAAILISLLLICYYISVPKIKADWGKEVRFIGFEEKVISKIVKDYSSPNDKIYLFGINSNIYVLSDRLPSKRWFDNFGWYLEIEGVQEEILSRWGSDKPKIILWKNPEIGQWYDLGVYQPKLISEFIIKNYNKVSEPYNGITLWELK